MSLSGHLAKKPEDAPENPSGAVSGGAGARLVDATTMAGLAVYAMAAPHSIAGAWIGLSVATLGWLARTLLTRRANLTRSPLDLPLALLAGWTVLSSIFSPEQRISVAKLTSLSTFFIFYLAQGTLTRRRIPLLVGLMILSGVAGVLWSLTEVARGRGVQIEEIASDSPFLRLRTPLQKGDAVWRVNERRISSVAEIDEALRRAPRGAELPISVISRGEHVEWRLPPLDDEAWRASSPSGLQGTRPTHRFRASGWTRHYETHAELLQMLAQLALGLTLAGFARRDGRSRFRWLAPPAFVLLAAGIGLTAMRTVLVAFAAGATVVGWRATSRRATRFLILAVVTLALVSGAFAVWRTRAPGALTLSDDSAALRWSVARHAVERVSVRPLLGHGMDAVKRHWQEWGFPGDEQVHTHSTPVQFAFERGLPALLFWFWLIAAAFLMTTRAERAWRSAGDAPAHGFLLGTTGALAGCFASSLVNYNFGDAEVTLLFWWLMGAVVALERERRALQAAP